MIRNEWWAVKQEEQTVPNENKESAFPSNVKKIGPGLKRGLETWRAKKLPWEDVVQYLSKENILEKLNIF